MATSVPHITHHTPHTAYCILHTSYVHIMYNVRISTISSSLSSVSQRLRFERIYIYTIVLGQQIIRLEKEEREQEVERNTRK